MDGLGLGEPAVVSEMPPCDQLSDRASAVGSWTVWIVKVEFTQFAERLCRVQPSQFPALLERSSVSTSVLG